MRRNTKRRSSRVLCLPVKILTCQSIFLLEDTVNHTPVFLRAFLLAPVASNKIQLRRHNGQRLSSCVGLSFEPSTALQIHSFRLLVVNSKTKRIKRSIEE